MLAGGWVTDLDPTDSTYEVDYAVLLREPDGSVDVRRDHHVEGLFPQATWLDLLGGVGFDSHPVEGPEGRIAFVGARPVGR